jgi:hypothetical protein
MTIRFSKFVASMLIGITLMLVAPLYWARGSDISVPSIRTDTLYDPLFGIEYRPSEIQFESAPDAVYKCNNLKSRHGDLFLFGKVAKGKVHFYFVYGWIEVDWDGLKEGVRHFEAESDSGIIVVVSPDGCHEIGAGYAWSPDKRERQMAQKYGITNNVVSALLSDAIDREVRAFGGEMEFLSRLTVTEIDESKLPAQIRNKLVLVRKKAAEKPPNNK